MVVRRWAELTRQQRAALVVMSSVQVTLAVAAWTDLARRPASKVNGGKLRWAAAIGVNFIGPVAYFRWGRKP